MSKSKCFVDSNIWLYRLIAEPTVNDEDDRKRTLATSLTSAEDLIVSTQVINEVCFVLSRKAAFSENQLKQIIQEFYDGCIVKEIGFDILVNASDLRFQYGFSFWDGLIVSTALAANAEILYSEDMHDGLVVANRLEIVNPFK